MCVVVLVMLVYASMIASTIALLLLRTPPNPTRERRLTCCVERPGAHSKSPSQANLINFCWPCPCVCVAVCARSRGFWGGGASPAHHQTIHFFDIDPNTKTGRGGGWFYVGSISNRRLLVTFGLSPASLLSLLSLFVLFKFLGGEKEGKEGV